MKKHKGIKLDQLYSDDEIESEVGLWRAVVIPFPTTKYTINNCQLT